MACCVRLPALETALPGHFLNRNEVVLQRLPFGLPILAVIVSLPKTIVLTAHIRAEGCALAGLS